MRTLSLVIPAYNEEARLPALLDTLASTAEQAVADGGFELREAIVVDDGSTDRTREILAAVTQPKFVAALGDGQNRGKGAAVAAGCSQARGDYVLLADVDLSTPLEELHKLTPALDRGADIVIGSRAVPGAMVERGPALRKLTGMTFSATVRAFTGLSVRDTQNGFKLLPADVARRLLSQQLCPGFAFDVELLMRANLEGLRVAEAPVLYVHDERSRVRVASASLQMLRDVAMLSRRLKPRRSARTRGGENVPRWRSDLPADDSE